MPLTGIKVIDFAMWAFAPGACVILGDWGAEVIKIEDPAGGDAVRGLTSVGNLPVADVNYPWELDGRNKRSIAINLKTEQGKDIMRRMLGNCDVFVSSIRAEALRRLALDYDTVFKINPRLIYAHVSGYGERGAENARPGFDHVAFWARSGVMAASGEPESAPSQQLTGFGDHTSSLALAGGIVAALFNRERTGHGQRVDVSLLGTALWCGSHSLMSTIHTGKAPPRVSRKERANPLFNSFQTKNGQWIMLACLQSDRYWPTLCKVLGIEELKDDPRYNSHLKRKEKAAAITPILDEAFLKKTRDEWGKAFDDNGIIWAPVQSFLETVNDPQVITNEFIVDMDHPVHGRLQTVASPVQFGKTPSRIRRSAPELGQHTEEILLELGYSWDDILSFKDSKVIL